MIKKIVDLWEQHRKTTMGIAGEVASSFGGLLSAFGKAASSYSTPDVDKPEVVD